MQLCHIHFYQKIARKKVARVNAAYQRWNRSGFSRPNPTGKFHNHRRLTDRSTGFFAENFCSLFNVSNKNFQRGGMDEVLKFVTLDGRLGKKRKKIFAFFAKMTQF